VIEHDGLGPLPLGLVISAKDPKEAVKELVGTRVWVKLAHQSHEDVAVDAAEVAELVAVDAALLRPAADAAEDDLEVSEGVFTNEFGDHVFENKTNQRETIGFCVRVSE